MESQNLLTTEATRFHEQLHCRNRYRVLVSRIEIEITTADQQVLRVWSLENDEPAGFERAAGFIEKLHQRFEREVLGEVKSGDGAQASIPQRSQVRERLALDDVQRQVFT